jgi:2-polyprenyl-3-methyl-5-hydroxy-6-metoxy-1,4-benzoquinol methylase
MKKQCPVCGESNVQVVFKARPLDYSADQEMEIARCQSCGYGHTVEAKYATKHYEGGSYDEKEKFWHGYIRPFLSVLERNKVRYIQECAGKSARVLEIGSGKGRLIKALIEQGFDAYGIEPSKRSFEVARQLGCNTIYNCTIDEMHSNPELNRQYDFIILWHVLEHLENPAEILKLLKRFLSKDGFIIIAVPNFDSWQAGFGTADWYHLDPSRHISHFTPRALQFLAEKNQMTVKRVFFNSFYQDWIGDIITVTNKGVPYKNMIFNFIRMNPNLLKKTGKVSSSFWFVVTLLLSILLLPLITILTVVSETAKKSGTLTVVMGVDKKT